MAKQLTSVVAVVLVTLCKSRADLVFEPARLPLAVLVAGQSETLRHELVLRNSGITPEDVHVAAQCDDNLSPHQAPWLETSVRNFTLAPSAVKGFNITFTAGALTQGVHSSRICAFKQTDSDTKSGLNPTPLAQIPIQAKVLCSQRGNSSSNQSSCGISIRQLALLKPLLRSEPGAPVLPSQTAELFFEAAVTFNHYPWPEWSSAADASKDVMVSNGTGNVYNVTAWPVGNSCGTYLIRGSTAVTTSSAGAVPTLTLQISISKHAFNSSNMTGDLVVASLRPPANALPCHLQQQIDADSLQVMGALPFLPSPKGPWSPIVTPFSLPPAYLVQGSANNTAQNVLILENAGGIDHSVQVVTNCYNESSAGARVPWLSLSAKDVEVPFKSSKSINLTYHAEGLAAGTYRAQLCLFADYSYGAVSSVVQVQLQVLCSRYQGYESSPPGCTIRFSEVHPLYFVRPINGSVSIPPIPTVFTADLAFNRPVLGPQSRNSLYGMLSGQGVPDGRIDAFEEDTSQGATCGMYHFQGWKSNDDNANRNVTVQVAGLYDITHMLNACSAQAD
ncbi:hypothetical protein ABBQ38_005669 [Trebouxia sp. C0009 RCD-2024]